MLTIVGLLSLGAAGCSSKDVNEPDAPDVPDQQVGEATVAFSLQVSVPTENGTRNSETQENGSSEDGTEDGKSNENQVKNAIIYFYEEIEDQPGEAGDTGSESNTNVKKNGNKLKFLAYFESTAKKKEGDGAEEYILTSTITKAKYETFKNIAGKEKLVVFVVANVSIGKILLTTNYGNYEWDPRYVGIHLGDNTDLNDFGTDGKGKAVPMSSKDFYYVNLSSIDAPESYDDFLKLFGGGDVGSGDDTQANYDINLTEDKYQRKVSENENSEKLNGDKIVIPLERDVARIDFKPKAAVDEFGDNVYPVGSGENRIANLNLKLTKLQVFNVRNNTNAFRQTAAGTKKGYSHTTADDFKIRTGVSLFGVERGTAGTNNEEDSYNWITDYDWYEKLSGNQSGLDATNKPVKAANSPIYKVDGTAGSITVEDLTSESRQFFDVTSSNNKVFNGYYPWRYLPENTVPTTSMMIQKYCSGVAFTMVICDKNGEALSENDFLTQAQIEETGSAAQGKIIIRRSLENSRYKYKDASGKDIDTNFYLLEIGDEEVYVEKTDAGFEMTYYLFMRHNYPTTPPHVLGDVQPMQYATVRNNVYKIYINSINNLPTPFEPENPVETGEYYMSAEINVLAWARRDITVSW